jgi:hypothetical protein
MSMGDVTRRVIRAQAKQVSLAPGAVRQTSHSNRRG